MKQGIMTKKDYKKIIHGSLFKDMENYSENFHKKNRDLLHYYSKKWVKDPLHQWSRQYEYPFVFSEILNYSNNLDKVSIIDAGSGITFFPYYINDNINSKMYCIDYDCKLTSLYQNVNKRNSNNSIEFSCSDIKLLKKFKKGSTDIIYSISVLEHTDNYKDILKEFNRILKPNGLLIMTFDISLDGLTDIPISNAIKLLKTLHDEFNFTNYNKLEEFQNMGGDDILSLKDMRNYDKELLPPQSFLSKMRFLSENIIKNRTFRTFSDISVYCMSIKKQ